MATALYRRYRPETFTEMIGQSHVTEPLMTALRSERVGHAYLFSGPRGCGKTTSARVLARCLNCAAGPTDSPCGTCPSCVELSRDGGGSLDVVEIDAASHGGVDDARELRERAVFAPARDRFKIFIIDEAHMVTPAGFNALLKIVEEPPPHVKFIFATTEPEKVIGTIRSRTHHYPFRLIAPGALIDYAQSLCESEGITVEPGVLPLVVRAGGGSVRDTLSILDQLIAGSEGTTVTIERAAGLLGFTSTELIDEVVMALAAADAAAAFAAIDRVVQTGQDPRRFVEDLLERLRDLIVIGATSVDGAAAVFRGVPEAQLNRMFQQSLAFGRGETSRLADLVSTALDSMAGATAPRLQLELLIARALVGATPGQAHQSTSAPTTSGANLNPGTPAMPAQNGAGSFAAQLSAARQAAAPQQQTHERPAAPAAASFPAQPAATVETPQAQPASIQVPAAHAGGPGLRNNAGPAAENPAQNVPNSSVAAPAPTFDSGPLAADAPPAASSYAPGQAPSDFVNAMRTARDFLKNDSAGAEQQSASGSPRDDSHTADAAPAHPTAEMRDMSAAAPAQPQTSVAPAPAVAETASVAASVPALVPTSEPVAAPQTAATPEVVAAPTNIVGQPSAPAAVDSEPQAPARSTVSAAAVTLADLRDVWIEILEELEHSDERAWGAITRVQPLELVDDTLTLGLTSNEDLNRFKSDGAGPLREAIDAALGIQVKYIPRRVAVPLTHASEASATPATSATREQSAPPAEDPDPARSEPALIEKNVSDSIAPLSASSGSQVPAVDPLEQRLGAVLGRITVQESSAPVAAGHPTAPSAQPQHAPSAQLSSPQSTPAPQLFETAVGSNSLSTSPAPMPAEDEYSEPPEDPYAYAAPSAAIEPAEPLVAPRDSVTVPVIEKSAVSDGPINAHDTTTKTSFAALAETASVEHHNADQSALTPSRSETETSTITEPSRSAETVAPQRTTPAPAFVRYGESVVREVLGARFVEERPLTTATDPQ